MGGIERHKETQIDSEFSDKGEMKKQHKRHS